MGEGPSFHEFGCRARPGISTFHAPWSLFHSSLPRLHVPHRPSVVGLTDVGRTRTRNEDSFSVIPELGVAVVADGMGGHPGGDVASGIAARTASEVLRLGLPTCLEPPEGEGPPDLGRMVRQCVISAHEAIRSRALREPELEGMGTTLTLFVADPASDAFLVGHVGDSRAYRLRDGELTQLTRDDTWVQDRIDAGQIGADQAKRHPFSHMLTQCLGLEAPPVPHVVEGSVCVGDRFLLCTDGLMEMLEDEQIEEILNAHLAANGLPGAEEPALRALIDAANDAGGHDNVTAVLFTIGPDSGG